MAKQKYMVICSNNNNNMVSAFIRDQDFDCRQRGCEVLVFDCGYTALVTKCPFGVSKKDLRKTHGHTC